MKEFVSGCLDSASIIPDNKEKLRGFFIFVQNQNDMGVGAIVLGSAALCLAIALVIEIRERF
tara:strand:+ start:126 stop:311 length:186 start_codon:yes stop_codon:yes gene_type:complete